MHQTTRGVQLLGWRVPIAGRGGVEPPTEAAAQTLPVGAVLPGLQQWRPQLQARQQGRHSWQQQVNNHLVHVE
jgi:hypothetical protein